MSDPYVFDLVSTRSSWLAERQRVVAGNVANADTPGFQAADVRPFEDVMARRDVTLSRSDPMHFSPARQGLVSSAQQRGGPGAIEHSGNTVSLEQELLKSGEVARSQRLANAILKAFHGMNITATRS